MGIDRRLVLNVDWLLLGLTLILSLIGVFTIYSATYSGHLAGLHLKQLYLVGAGLVALLLSLLVDYRRLADRAFLLYVAGALSLVYVLLFGPVIAGTRRWILIGSFQLQPSELVKLAVAFFLAKVFAEYNRESLGLLDIFWPSAGVFLLVALIALGPDLGTAACLVPALLAVAFLAGLRMRAVLALLLVLAVSGALAWPFLKDYQKARVYTFLDPSLDPKGAGYHKIQSQIAAGSGGLLGKGFGEGSQSQLGYLPARHTDFVLSVFAEEMGFVGIAVVLGLYLLWLWRILETAQLARDRVGAFLCAALAAMFAFQVVYNSAMVAGLVPVKGLPLPLMSSGGSSVLASLIGVGLVINVRMRRFAN